MSETVARFDLIYVSGPEGRTMSCGIVAGAETKLIGPFPAGDAGPAIVQALLDHSALGFTDKKQAETAYMLAHFHNMSRGENDAGQAYPYKFG
jgi:hypothetical protein